LFFLVYVFYVIKILSLQSYAAASAFYVTKGTGVKFCKAWHLFSGLAFSLFIFACLFAKINALCFWIAKSGFKKIKKNL